MIKTGTLTTGLFVVTQVTGLDGTSEDKVLRIAAAVDEQSCHPLAAAIVRKARERKITFPTATGIENLAGKGIQAHIESTREDEVPHIRFQCERLAILHRSRPAPLRALTMAVHRLCFTGITLAVWVGHRRALRAGGYHFSRFWRSAWAKMRIAWRQMTPEICSPESAAETGSRVGAGDVPANGLVNGIGLQSRSRTRSC